LDGITTSLLTMHAIRIWWTKLKESTENKTRHKSLEGSLRRNVSAVYGSPTRAVKHVKRVRKLFIQVLIFRLELVTHWKNKGNKNVYMPNPMHVWFRMLCLDKLAAL
jgi:hypothetical protein